MQFLVKIFAEVTVKSMSLRKKFMRQLKRNLQEILFVFDIKVQVTVHWDHLRILTHSDDVTCIKAISCILSQTPGIAQWLQGIWYQLDGLESIFESTFMHYEKAIEGKSFCVRCNRSGKHTFSSVDVERFVGERMGRKVTTAWVKLKEPEVTIRIEIKKDRFFIVCRREPGLGGFPMGTQGKILSLVSGGYDSSVSSYLMMRRGLITHFLFFNIGGKHHEIAVKEIVCFLWSKYGSSHDLKLIVIPFENVIEEVINKISNALMGVVLKRLMMRVASKVAFSFGARAIATGEAVGQVSSQTLDNLSVIDKAANLLVLRPLITEDKQIIIDIAKSIGTAEFSGTMSEYCAVISKKPSAAADVNLVLKEEESIQQSVLDSAVSRRKVISVRDITKKSYIQDQGVVEIECPEKGDVVIDLRHFDEIEKLPLKLSDVEVQCIPYYQLATKLPQLDQSKRYLLYCRKSIMSRLQAAYLHNEGQLNVGVYHPNTKTKVEVYSV